MRDLDGPRTGALPIMDSAKRRVVIRANSGEPLDFLATRTVNWRRVSPGHAHRKPGRSGTDWLSRCDLVYRDGQLPAIGAVLTRSKITAAEQTFRVTEPTQSIAARSIGGGARRAHVLPQEGTGCHSMRSAAA